MRDWDEDALFEAKERACLVWESFGCPEDPAEWEAAKRMAVRYVRGWHSAGGDKAFLEALGASHPLGRRGASSG